LPRWAGRFSPWPAPGRSCWRCAFPTGWARAAFLPRDAMLALSVAPEQRGLAFGFHRALDNAGAVVGPLLAAWLLYRGMPIRDILLWTLCRGDDGRPGAVHPRAAPRDATTQTGFQLDAARLSAGFQTLPAGAGAVHPGQFVQHVPAAARSGNGAGRISGTAVVGSGVGMAMLFSTPLSALSDRLGRTRLIVGGWRCMACSTCCSV